MCSISFSQKASVVRMEVPAALEAGAFHLEILKQDGIMIFYESNEISDAGQRKWYFGLFDTQLNQVWLKFIPLSDGIQYVKSVRNGILIHFLFRSIKSGKSPNDFYEIVTYNTKGEVFSNISGTIPKDAELSGFEAIEDKACLGLNLKKDNTDVLFINLNNGEIVVQSIESENESYIETIDVDQVNKYFYVAVKYIKDKRYLEDKIIRYSSQGVVEKTYLINNTESIKTPRDYIIMPLKNSTLTVLGTYDIITGRSIDFSKAADEMDATSAGMFFLQFENDVQTKLNFYDFMSFDNIYSSMNAREMSYTKETSDTAGNKKPEKKLSAFFHFNAPSVIELNDQYILSVEIYKPYYTSETRMDYDFYGRPIPMTYEIFDGYQFYDLIIASLSKKGDLNWNNDFEIKGMKTYFLKKQVAVFPDDEFLSMAYINNGKIYSQTINAAADLNKEETTIESQFAKDRVSEDENNTIVHWYDDYFLIYGYQKIKNRSLGDQSTRTVFYANKVAYN